MEITRTAKAENRLGSVKVWYCGGCGIVHMSVGKTLVNFDREEFSALAEAVTEINCTAWPIAEGSVIDLIGSEKYAGAIVH